MGRANDEEELPEGVEEGKPVSPNTPPGGNPPPPGPPPPK